MNFLQEPTPGHFWQLGEEKEATAGLLVIFLGCGSGGRQNPVGLGEIL